MTRGVVVVGRRYAERAADYFIDHLPADRVPYWDFELPNPGAGTPKEASAAAAAAAGLLDLVGYVPDPDRYRDAGLEILEALASPAYLGEGTPHRSILLHSNANVNTGSEVDVGHVYADYYFLEAILRYRNLDGS
jgi:unsaturated chondroitin disaccharide hydrolase